MQAVILAAGKSTRTYPLTINKPKPLLKIGNKTLLEYNLDQLNGLVKEVILIVGFKANSIKKQFKKRYKKLKISYVLQKPQLGTGHALAVAKNKIKNKFIVLMADDLYSRNDIKKCIKHKYSVLAKKVKDPSRFGVYTVKNGFVTDLVEKPKKPVSNLANTALYVLDKEIFNELKKIKRSPRGEYELTDSVRALAKKEKVKCVAAKQWISVGYPWNLFDVKKLFRIKGNSIGKNCKIKGKVINSIIMDNSIIEKGSIVKDSIIGEGVYFKGKIESKSNVISIIKNKKIKVLKLGAIIGDKVTAKNVIIQPGTLIWPNIKKKNKKLKGVVKK
ncbi:NTP transferase domain-containing protein [Candidatus Woesearchaeota archaeon]|nr:NTP transferase domain-containing protein [Candidatus Woesearchaeota archaeon]